MSFLSKLRRVLFGWDLNQPELTAVEVWAQRVSKLSTPDQIIAAAIVASVAKNFDDWTLDNRPELDYNYNYSETYYKYSETYYKKEQSFKARYGNIDSQQGIYNSKTGVAVGWKSAVSKKGVRNYTNLYVNKTKLSDADGIMIPRGYFEIVEKRRLVKEAEDRALADMKRNEEAWNLVEKLTGHKRNEHGALVPCEPIE